MYTFPSTMECFRKAVAVLFGYYTPKIVLIRSKRIGIINRILQIIVVSYVIGYAMVWKKGYQLSCPVSYAVTTKVKGVTYTTKNEDNEDVPKEYVPLYNRIWDPIDYVVPAGGGEYGGFFIMTNVVATPNQTRGVCPESPAVFNARCKTDNDCPKGKSLNAGNGVFTGKCNSTNSSLTTQPTCEIFAWCPVERDEHHLHKEALLEGAKNFTVLIKNVIEFPIFGAQYKRRNILEDRDKSYLQSCIFHPDTDIFCPIFKIGYIVERAGENFSEIAVKGGLIEISITWNCNLDEDFLEYCTPKYSFYRKDSPNSAVSPGFNFRTAQYHEENRRTLFKNFGIKFLVKVSGEGRKFNMLPLLFNLGSGLALLGLTTFLCDWLVLYCTKNRQFYREQKFQVVKVGRASNNAVRPEDPQTREVNQVDNTTVDNDEDNKTMDDLKM